MLRGIIFIVCFFASTVGAICGIGGGVIIKPVLDSFGFFSVSTISFLSGCTVLAMSLYSVMAGKIKKDFHIEQKTGIPLIIGAVLGGYGGKVLFQSVRNISNNQQMIGAVQAGCLLLLTLGSLLYSINKNKIKTYHIERKAACIIIGIALGVLSSFLGIGGGPINLIVLFYFFSMDTKTAAGHSLYIILFSQLTSLLHSVFTNSIPEFSSEILLLMVMGGILGGVTGRKINNKIASPVVDKLFVGLMVVLIGINLYNLYKFL